MGWNHQLVFWYDWSHKTWTYNTISPQKLFTWLFWGICCFWSFHMLWDSSPICGSICWNLFQPVWNTYIGCAMCLHDITSSGGVWKIIMCCGQGLSIKMLFFKTELWTLKLGGSQVHLWKLMLGRRSFPLGARHFVRGELFVSGRV